MVWGGLMGKFEIDFHGIEDLMLDMKQVAEIPWEVQNEMLQAGGAVIAETMKREYRTQLTVRTGNLSDSITVTPKMAESSDGNFVTVYPYGKHHTYTKRVKVKTYKNSKSGRTYKTGGKTAIASNNDVAFVHEFGSKGRGIGAKHIMQNSTDKSRPAAVEAMRQVYDEWLKKNGF